MPLSSTAQMVWLLALGVMLGLGFLVAAQLSRKWFIFLFLLSLMGPIALTVPNRRELLLILLTLSVPVWIGMHIYYHKTPFGRSTFGFPIHFSFIPLAALYVSWIANRVVWKIPGPVSTRGLGALAGLFVVAACSVFVAKEPLFAIFDVFALATSLAIFIYMSSQINEGKDLHLIVTVMICFAFFQGLIAIGQRLTGTLMGFSLLGGGGAGPQPLYGYAGLEAVSRVGGWIGHPNSLALFFDLMVPLSFSLLFYPLSRRLKFWLAVAIVIEVLGLGVTYSRGGIMATSLALFLLAIFFWKKKMGLTRAFFGVLSIAVIGATLLLIIPNPLRTGLFRTEGTAYGRWPLIEVATNIISHRPLLGTGLNNFVVTAPPYDFTREQIVAAWNSPVHNLFFFIGAETGLLGLGFFLLLLWRVMTWLYPALKVQDPFLHCVGTGLFFGILAFYAHAQVDYTIWTQNRLMWFILGLAVSIGRFARLALANQKVAVPQGSGA